MKPLEMLQNWSCSSVASRSASWHFKSLFPHFWEVQRVFERRSLLPHSPLPAEVIEVLFE